MKELYMFLLPNQPEITGGRTEERPAEPMKCPKAARGMRMEKLAAERFVSLLYFGIIVFMVYLSYFRNKKTW